MTVINMECRDGMAMCIADNSIDAIVTDPPYGLSKQPDMTEVLRHWLAGDDYVHGGSGFMGKSWDSFVPGPAVWKEAIRCLKPGGWAVVFAGSRTQDLMALSLRLAGFEIMDTGMWLYGCLSDDTEVLTRDGWELYHKATGKEILTYDHKGDFYQWETPERWSTYNIERDTAFRIRSDCTDQIVSRNHRCLVERDGNLVFVTAEKLRHLEIMPALRDDILELLQETGQVLQPSMQRFLPGESVGKTLQQGSSVLDCDESCELPKENDWREQSSMEGGSHVFQTEREVREPADQICKMPRGHDVDGTKGWVCYGAQTGGRTGDRATSDSVGVRAPRKPRRDRQSAGEPDAVCDKLRPQTVRARASYNTTLAVIEPIEYSGVIFCPTVSSGAFVARRLGKVFVTGNSGFPKSMDISKAIDRAAGAEREVVGRGENYGASKAADGKQAFGDYAVAWDITAPATDAAKRWQGWGTALKPAYEPFILCRKPLDGTYANNVLTHGCGALNIDGCRVPSDEQHKQKCASVVGLASNRNGACYGEMTGAREDSYNELGRWPANVISTELDEPWAKYFYCAKASKRDRDEGLEHMPLTDSAELVDREPDSDGMNSPRAGAGRTSGRRNVHPTVKPTDLMRYLCRLVTPPGGLVMDPFSGSGSTGKAATIEGFQFVGFEMDEKYAEIANARIEWAKTQPK